MGENKKEGKIEQFEVTNLFSVTDQKKLTEIVKRIKSESGVLIYKNGDKVGLVSYSSMKDCVPLSVADEFIDMYQGQTVSTLTLIQQILKEGDECILSSTRFDKDRRVLHSKLIFVNDQENTVLNGMSVGLGI